MLKSHRKNIVEALGRKPIHPFPARMAPGIALDALGENRSLRVLDPMAGSGTVLAVARSKGHRAYGFDLDPLAVLMSRVWTQTIDSEQVKAKAEQVLRTAIKIFPSITTGSAYPDGCDDETRAFLRFWFDAYSRRQLAALSISIRRVRDSAIRDVMWCGFSRLIITKSSGASLAMDLSHSRPHKAFSRAPVKPFNRFLNAVQTVAANCPEQGTKGVGPAANMRLGDARQLSLPDKSIDLVLTSPPYLNAIDYMRCSKFSLVWMGYNLAELRQIRGGSVGAEIALPQANDSVWVKSLLTELKLKPSLSARDEAILARYVWDMGRALSEASRVLRDGGRAVYVVGDCTVRGTFIPNSSIVEAVAARSGLKFSSRHSRSLPANRRYMPPPKSRASNGGMDSRMRREVVIVFDKVKAER